MLAGMLGARLQWRLTDPNKILIDWASATHPTVDATPVSLAAVPALVATLETPRGIFVLR